MKEEEAPQAEEEPKPDWQTMAAMGIPMFPGMGFVTSQLVFPLDGV